MLTLLAGCASNPPAHPPPPPSAPAAAAAPTTSASRPDAATLRLQQDLAAVFGADIMAHAQWAVSIRSLDSGELLYALNPGKMMVPASNMKIVTLAVAAEALGWDRRFTTTLETSGSIEAGVLRGDLIVRGGGDPTINTREGRGAAVFAEWCATLQALGIHEIEGRVIGDDQLFDDEGLGGGWAWDYLQYGYAAPVGALQFNENVASLVVLPGAAAGDPAVLTFPAGTGLSVWNRAFTGAPGTPETIDFRRHLDRPMLEITGSVPLAPASPDDAAADRIRTVVRQVAVVNPTLYFAQAFEDALAAAGIRVTGAAADFDDVAPALVGVAAERRVLATTVSPP
ncbi:MAG: D-alanyl-D-alanine carboxypeptidase/D-alanyl-D-alanine endopeptidase, partial [Vicinamibacterales bacterium]